ncbi:DUF2591 domain-containing protein [Enterobacter intestinihominis]|nr:DUF2591 domain-containing protein [Enterobacter hormaechei subsp. xiangfangensis]HAV1671118.1 DUF2591 domain-containing protein [Enterobacter hormaechei subsp. xiangfangensis]HAV2002708.1 DUF2591 domain-containing protein [Enterobacter hormaechei subsp. xiangfangensis]
MDYSKLSDFEINKAVAEIVIYGDWLLEPTDESPSWFVNLGVQGKNTIKLPDYCNNPADAWTIIVGHKLSLINADDEWLCVPEDTAVDGITGDGVQMIYSGAGAVHANPLRAAMVMFLTIQDESNADV